MLLVVRFHQIHLKMFVLHQFQNLLTKIRRLRRLRLRHEMMKMFHCFHRLFHHQIQVEMQSHHILRRLRQIQNHLFLLKLHHLCYQQLLRRLRRQSHLKICFQLLVQ